MSDLPTHTLQQQEDARPMSGEQLETLGKKAAALYHCAGTGLNDAVVEVVKEARLSPEQVKRVVEFTNSHAYLDEFRKEGGEHKVVEFDGGPASSSEVLKDLNDGGGGSIYDTGSDYTKPPESVVKLSSKKKLSAIERYLAGDRSHGRLGKETLEYEVKTASAEPEPATLEEWLEKEAVDIRDALAKQKAALPAPPTVDRGILASPVLKKFEAANKPKPKGMFGSVLKRLATRGKMGSAPGDYEAQLWEMFGKEAAEYPLENPMGPLVILRDKLAGAQDQVNSELSSLEVDYADAGDQMYAQVKQATLGGTSLGDIVQAWSSSAPDPTYVKVAFQLITPRLHRDTVFNGSQQIDESIQKVGSADRMVNTNHPLVGTFETFCELLTKMASLRSFKTEVIEGLNQAHALLKQANLGKPAATFGKALPPIRPPGSGVIGPSAIPKAGRAGGHASSPGARTGLPNNYESKVQRALGVQPSGLSTQLRSQGLGSSEEAMQQRRMWRQLGEQLGVSKYGSITVPKELQKASAVGGLARKALDTGKRIADAGGEAGHKGLSYLVGDSAPSAKAISTGLKWTGGGTAALGGLTAAQSITDRPMVQGATGAYLSMVPGTREYEMRRARTRMGM